MNADELLARYGQGNKIKVLDDVGHVFVVDCMGGDTRIEQVARRSYEGGRKRSDTRGLLRYLLRHRHCYHPSMEVLTASGWKRWDECDYEETFLVPDPETRTLHKERLVVEEFEAEEEMVTYENDRMSFCVTPDHRMWFRPKSRAGDPDGFQIYRANVVPRCGHFDPLRGYVPAGYASDPYPPAQLAGFILGDGSWSSRQVTFHIKKERKKTYLRDLLTTLDINYAVRPSTTYADAEVFTITPPPNVVQYLIAGQRAAEKELAVDVSALEGAEILGLWDGLVNSDGSVKEDRPQVQFSSASPHLRKLFQTLSAYLGVDAHEAGTDLNVTAYPGGRTSLEARVQYWSSRYYTGKVYCATTSTGLLMVRGGSDKFAFVCGNTSPFEQAVITLDIKLPIFVARQLVRHRTQSLNEISGRYSVLPEEFYTPAADQVCYQAADNKQGRAGPFPSNEAEQLRNQMKSEGDEAFVSYRQFREAGMALETARLGLPLSIYTHWVTTWDLHNLLHMLELRLDPHAQWEIRKYAEAIWAIVQAWCPLTAEAFVDYRLEAATFSKQDMAMLRDIVSDWKSFQDDLCESAGRESATHLAGHLKEMLDRHDVGSARDRLDLLRKLGLAT